AGVAATLRRAGSRVPAFVARRAHAHDAAGRSAPRALHGGRYHSLRSGVLAGSERGIRRRGVSERCSSDGAPSDGAPFNGGGPEGSASGGTGSSNAGAFGFDGYRAGAPAPYSSSSTRSAS